MRHTCLSGTALAAVLACGQLALAQSTSAFQQSSTTGMLGFTTNQTARLNVLNLNPAPGGTTAAPSCTVQLQFFDAQNNLVKQTTVPNVAPQTASSLDMHRAEVTSQTGQRAEIRGVVSLNLTPITVDSLAPPSFTGFCSVMVTLEIVDDATGSTVAFTADTRSAGLPVISPLAGRPLAR